MCRRMLFFCFCFGLLSGDQILAEPIRVMSFNIRYGTANDGENHWKKRNWLVAETIKDFAPDLMGTQETLKFQADYLKAQLKDYTYFGRSRMKTPNEHCGIFYKTSRFTQLAGGYFWLSETPDVVESKSWDSSLPRMASWVLLGDDADAEENQPARPILFVNTHFDHRGRVARVESAKVIRSRIAQLTKIAADPIVIVTGDFNTPEASDPYTTFLESSQSLSLVDTFRAKHPNRDDNEGTFNGFQGRADGGRIDWILVSKGVTVLDAAIVSTSENERYPSDHFPITAIVQADHSSAGD